MLTVKVKIKTVLIFIIKCQYKYIYYSIRRRLLFYFAREYFNNKLSMRKGKCKMTGCCCKCVVPWCPYLDLVNGRCAIYNNKQPFFCRVYPLDEKEIELTGMKQICGYYFEEK